MQILAWMEAPSYVTLLYHRIAKTKWHSNVNGVASGVYLGKESKCVQMSAHDYIEEELLWLDRELKIAEKGLQIVQTGKDVDGSQFKTFADQMRKIKNYKTQISNILNQIAVAKQRKNALDSTAVSNIYCVKF